jgi:CBS domain-containing protein
MKVRDIMTISPACCAVNDDLAQVTSAMFEKDCGVLPVLGPDGTVVGMITDRDVAIAAATRNRTPSLIVVAEVITGTLHFCRPDDDLADALGTMSLQQVRRIPVLDPEGRIAGLLSLNDAVRHAAASPAGASLRRLVLEAASRIGGPHGAAAGDAGTSAGKVAVRRRTAKPAARPAPRGKRTAAGKKRGPS